MATPREKLYYCEKCGRTMNGDQFYTSNNLEKYPEGRLNICKECDLLINGMCKLCGCFVEIRAAVKKNYCPNKNRYW